MVEWLQQNENNKIDTWLTTTNKAQLNMILQALTIEDRNQILNAYIEKINRNKYKYNIQTAKTTVLEDLRNAHVNFRSSVNDISISKNKDTTNLYKLNDVKGPGVSRSYYMSNNDFIFSESFNLSDDDANKPYVQPIILNEFQPDDVVLLNEVIATTISSISQRII